MRIIALLALAASAPALANSPAITQMPAENEPPAVTVHTYGLVADKMTARQLVAQLNRLCESRRARDQRRCEAAWHEINAAHAQLQAKRSAITRD